MPLSKDPEKRRRQLAYLNPRGNRHITGLLEMELENPKKIQINMNRTVRNSDKDLIDEGEVVLNNIQLIDPPENYTVKNFFDTQSNLIQEGLAKTFGRDKKLVNELIQKRLNHTKNDWIYALPLMYENKNGRKITEDNFNFVKHASRDKLKIASIEPKKLIELSNDKEKRFDGSLNHTRNHIKKGKPIPTPRIELNKDGDIESIEGISRVKGALIEGVKEIPVYIITRDPIESMSRLQRVKIDNVDFKKVN